jgi:hypothetical protein
MLRKVLWVRGHISRDKPPMILGGRVGKDMKEEEGYGTP